MPEFYTKIRKKRYTTIIKSDLQKHKNNIQIFFQQKLKNVHTKFFSNKVYLTKNFANNIFHSKKFSN